MKKLLVGLLALGSLSALAHPQSDDLLVKVGLDSTLTTVKDINVRPGIKEIRVANGCNLVLRSRSSKDRVITAGTTLKIVGTSKYKKNRTVGSTYDLVQKLKLDHNEIKMVKCDNYSYIQNFSNGRKQVGVMKIGDFEDQTSELLRLDLATPEQI